MQKKPIIFGAVILLIAIVVIGLFIINSKDDDSSSEGTKNSETHQSTSSTTSDSSSENDDSTTSSKPASFTVSLTTPVDGEEIDGDVVTVRTIVNGTNSGECTVTFSQAGQEDVTATAAVGQITSYSSCQGFDIDKSKFPSSGSWNLVVEVSHNGERATSQKQTVVIK